MFLNSFQKTPKILDIPRTWISDCGETVAVTLMDIAVFRALIRFKSSSYMIFQRFFNNL